MIDAPLRRILNGPLSVLARAIDVPWVTPDRITMAGLVVGVGSAGLAAIQWWPAALAAWLVSRILDGLDGGIGPSASLPKHARPDQRGGRIPGYHGGLVVYGTAVLGVAVGVTIEFGASWWPFLAVLLAYYLNGATFLAFSSIAERTGRRLDDGDPCSFLGKIAEARRRSLCTRCG